MQLALWLLLTSFFHKPSIPLFHLIPNTYATSFYPQPFPEGVQQAPVIVRGKIGMSYTDYGKTAEESKQIYTYYELQVAEVLKGSASGNSVMIRELGGEKDGVGLAVAGVSKYERGEEVVVFLRDKNSESTFDVHGMMMGKLNVQTDPEGREYLVGPAISMDPNPKDHGHPPHQKWFLEDLRHLVQEQAQKSPPSKPFPTHKASPAASPEPPPQLLPTHNAASPAPALQPSESEDSSYSRGLLFLGIGIGVLGVLGLFRVFSRKN